ncbi:MAG: hypothetical protein RLZZ59_745 [Pseudomonadota bacterium]|jgi:lipid A 4'-phosphatase
MRLREYSFFTTIFIFIILVLFPEYDIAISMHFYDAEKGFMHAHSIIATTIFKAVPIVSLATGAFLTLGVLKKYVELTYKSHLIKSPLIFLLLSLILGPGLIVNGVLKENWGRARPNQITLFGGEKNFSPAIYRSQECKTNCSFSSGHAAMGFYFTSLAWILPSPIKTLGLIFGTVIGLIIGLGRIAQGGHFFSDVIFSFIVIMITNWISFTIWRHFSSKVNDSDNSTHYQQKS